MASKRLTETKVKTRRYLLRNIQQKDRDLNDTLVTPAEIVITPNGGGYAKSNDRVYVKATYVSNGKPAYFWFRRTRDINDGYNNRDWLNIVCDALDDSNETYSKNIKVQLIGQPDSEGYYKTKHVRRWYE